MMASRRVRFVGQPRRGCVRLGMGGGINGEKNENEARCAGKGVRGEEKGAEGMKNGRLKMNSKYKRS